MAAVLTLDGYDGINIVAAEIRSFLSNLHNEVIPPGGRSLSLCFPWQSVPRTVHVPDHTDIGQHGLWTVAVACRRVSPATLVDVLGCLLIEGQLVVCCDDVEELSAVVLSLVCLLRPLVWQSTFIPLLPTKLVDMLAAPVPYLYGMIRAPHADQWPDTCWLDVHSDTFTPGLSRDSPPMPQHDALIRELTPLRTALERHFDPRKPAWLLAEGEERAVDRILKCLQSHFADFVFGDLRRHCIKNVSLESDGEWIFLKESFLEAAAPASLAFLECFCDTMLFGDLMENICQLSPIVESSSGQTMRVGGCEQRVPK
jgi:hypothetical protein